MKRNIILSNELNFSNGNRSVNYIDSRVYSCKVNGPNVNFASDPM